MGLIRRSAYVRPFRYWPVQRQIDLCIAKGIKERLIYVEGRDGQTIRQAIMPLREGDLLEVVEFRVLGTSREAIGANFEEIRNRGAGVLELSTGDIARDAGALMFRRAIAAIHRESVAPNLAELKRRSKKGGDAKGKNASQGRMPQSEALLIWRNELLDTGQAVATINADDRYPKKWSRVTLYRTLGTRGVITGRPSADHREKAVKRRRMAHKDGMIYFCRAGNRGPVKIGYSTDVDGRIANHQISNHGKLQLIAAMSGTIADEKALHKRFARERVSGEWFKMSPRLKAYIASLPKDYV